MKSVISNIKPIRKLDYAILGVVIATLIAFLLVAYLPGETPSSIEVWRDGKQIATFYPDTALAQVIKCGKDLLCYRDGTLYVAESDGHITTHQVLIKKHQVVLCKDEGWIAIGR